MKRIALIGYGYWGPNYLRVCRELPESEIAYICDISEENRNKAVRAIGRERVTDEYTKIMADESVDVVIVSTPLHTHYAIARSSLEQGKHVLVEKPFTQTYSEALDLLALGKKRRRFVKAGHIYEYSPAVCYAKRAIESGELGTVYYMHSERTGLGPIRKHASALWDLATHDISIALLFANELPDLVTTIQGRYLQCGVGDTAFVHLHFPSGLMCSIHASWISPEKIRKITLVGSKVMATIDDVNKSEPVKIYKRDIHLEELDSTPDYSDHQNIIHMGDIYIPNIEQYEPLKRQVQEFLRMTERYNPDVSDRHAADVILILEAAERSLREQKAVQCR
ncbi:MAG: Gfo/Idh/MocA family oxidoreductase [Chitinispirillaceae bacterium]|nr:Gfo/Idh/MocA family oxidoreductase [Chitinispirillaceae bacterium]